MYWSLVVHNNLLSQCFSTSPLFLQVLSLITPHLINDAKGSLLKVTDENCVKIEIARHDKRFTSLSGEVLENL